MDEKMISYILENHELDMLDIRQQKESIEMENEKFLISVTIYHHRLAEEIIYDKVIQETAFYFHHECLNDQQAVSYLDDFLKIASEMTRTH